MYSESAAKWYEKDLLQRYAGTIYLFILLMLFTVPVTLPIPGTGKHIVFYAAEVFVIFEWVLSIIIYRFRMPQSICLDEAYVNNVRTLSVFFWGYVIISRLYLLTTGFDIEWILYPRVSLIFLIAYFWIIRKDFSSIEKIDAVLMFVTYLNIYQIIWYIQNGSIRYSELLININIYMCVIVVVLPTIIHLVMNPSSGIRRFWYVVLLLSSLALVFMSGSRAGTGIAVCIVCYEIIKERNLRGSLLIFVIIAAFAIILLSNAYSSDTQAVLDRSFSIITGKGDDFTNNPQSSDAIRSRIWMQGLQQFMKGPLLGTGIFAMDYMNGNTLVHQSPHNFIIEMLMSYGIVGTVIYSAVLYNIFKSNRIEKNGRRIINLTIISYLGVSFFEPTFLERIILFVFLLVITSNPCEMTGCSYISE